MTVLRYLSETEERNLDYSILTPGYIRNVIELNVNTLPEVIVDLCNHYIIPKQFETEGADPTNYISDKDKEIADQYKAEGNQYFKSKNYEDAVSKYTTALRFNPNNHLLYCNRAYCYYLLSKYADALMDAQQCVNIRPSFCKGWLRYACVLQKQEKYGKAAIAYQTAYNLSIQWNENATQTEVTNAYKLHYTKFMKKMEDEKRSEALEYVTNFSENGTRNWVDAFDAMADKFPQLKEIIKMKDNDEMNAEAIAEFYDIMENENELVQQKEEEDFRALAEQSKCQHLVTNNGFQFGESDHEFWEMSWSSTPQIDKNKRIICVNIVAHSGMILNNWLQHGVPNAQQYIYMLFRAMTYCNLSKTKAIKPRALKVGYRLKNEFEAIQREMRKFGVICLLQTAEQNQKACDDNKTDVEGWNHL
eukprot:51755_1